MTCGTRRTTVAVSPSGSYAPYYGFELSPSVESATSLLPVLTPNLKVQRIRSINPAGDKAYYHQWSVGAQKQLTSSLVTSADYIGTRGGNIWTLRNLNQQDPVTKVFPYPNLGAIE
jgi:hypothetical protein